MVGYNSPLGGRDLNEAPKLLGVTPLKCQRNCDQLYRKKNTLLASLPSSNGKGKKKKERKKEITKVKKEEIVLSID